MATRAAEIALATALALSVAPCADAKQAAPSFLEIDQQLMDAWATGNPAAWEHYLDPRAVYVNEDGKVMTKAELVAEVKPLPSGWSTSFEVTEHRVIAEGRSAVTTHLDLEDEKVLGQTLRPRLRATESWRLTPAGWRIMSVQVTALPSDPPFSPLPQASLDQYAGDYTAGPGHSIRLRREGDRLRVGTAGPDLLSEAPDVFFIPGRPRERKIFVRAPDGSIRGLADRREGHDLFWTRVTS